MMLIYIYSSPEKKKRILRHKPLGGPAGMSIVPWRTWVSDKDWMRKSHLGKLIQHDKLKEKGDYYE